MVTIKRSNIVFRDDRYSLRYEDGYPIIEINSEKYKLTCHPYEPCLYITDKSGNLTAVHNAFDPVVVFDSFAESNTVTSITGTEYDALSFCKMVEYAVGMADIRIDEAEKIFRDRAKKKDLQPENMKEKSAVIGVAPCPEFGKIIEDDPVYFLIAEYPDSVIDWCLVENEHIATGYNAHCFALLSACRKLFIDWKNEAIWHFDIGKSDAVQISADELFAPVDKNNKLNYRRAFLFPPYENGYSDADFDKINAALFPNGKEELEVFEWTTDWSEYFDEGHEWWGTLCMTVYDKSLDRFVVILASATD